MGCVVEESLATTTILSSSSTQPTAAAILGTTRHNGISSSAAAAWLLLLGTNGTKPVFVASVKPGGHAALAGVRPGDVIAGVTNGLLYANAAAMANANKDAAAAANAAMNGDDDDDDGGDDFGSSAIETVAGLGIDKVYV